MIGSILSDALGHSIKLAIRFLLGAAIGAGSILGFAVASGAVPASEINLENAQALVDEVRAKVEQVTGFWNDLDPDAVKLVVQTYGGGMDDVFAGPDGDDYGTVDAYGEDADAGQFEGSEESGY